MNILLTGASGFVGKAMLRHFADVPNVQCRVAVRREMSEIASFRHHLISGIDAKTDWTAASQGIDTVVHLAARVHVMNDKATDPLAAFRAVNVEGTLNLARQASQMGVRRLVYLSSIKVLGESTCPGESFTEDSIAAPCDPYGISKLEAEQGLQHIARQTGLEVVILRPPLVYGPGVGANFHSLMRAVQRGLPLPLGAIQNQRSLVAVDNLTSAISLCTHHPQAANQTFLVSDQQDLSTPELIRAIAHAQGVKPCLIPVPVLVLTTLGKLTGKSAAVQRLCGNLQINSLKISELLGWKPVVTVQQALAATVFRRSST